MSQTTEERLAKVHDRARKRFDLVYNAQREERMQCLADRRFCYITGAQWEGGLDDQFENKPRFELNQVHLSVIRIVNEYRNNRITVSFSPKDGAPNDKFADVCAGLYRADENASTADEAYDNAFEEASAGGIGAWRLRARYEDDEDDDNDMQRVDMEPIFDADSCVFFDVDDKRQDKRNSKWAFVLTPMGKDAYIEEYDDDPADWPHDIRMTEFDWCTPDVVWIAEYFEVEEKKQDVAVYRSKLLPDEKPMEVTQDELEADPGKADELIAKGFYLARTKRRTVKKVTKYTMNGARIIEKPDVIPGTMIPVIICYGKRQVVDGTERYMGHVRLAKDAQRLFNMLMSWLAEIAARWDAEKPILTPEQIKGHAQLWAEDNIKRYPYLLANAMTDGDGNPMPLAGLPYTKAPNIPPAMAALMQIAQQALQDLLGNQQAGEEMQPAISGRAVELIQNRLDMQVFIYMSNFAKGMKRCGQVWLSMMKAIAVEQARKMKTLGADGQQSSAVINQPGFDEETGEDTVENDITKATFDVDVDVGPNSSSQRAAVVRALTGIASITDDPELKQALTITTIANLEGEGLSDLRDWARAKAVRMGLMKPTDEEKAQLQAEAQQPQPPSPSDQFLIDSANEKKASAELKAAQTAKTMAEVPGAEADASKTAAETAKLHAETHGENLTHAIDASTAMHNILTPKTN